jgi:hypothetical protein
VAFGLIAGDVPSRLLVGVVVLGLLAAVSEEQPLICVADDAQVRFPVMQISERICSILGRPILIPVSNNE